MPPTLAVATGNHGWHLYYRHPGQPVLSRPLPGTSGVDVKADGGYCVLPPSIHPATWRPYRWANHLEPQEMPPRLAELLLAPPATAAVEPQAWTRAQSSSHQLVRHPDKLVAACLAAVARAPEGRRRVTLYGAARGVARAIHAGYNPATGTAQLTQAGHDAGQTDRDIHAAITTAFTAEGLHSAERRG